MLNKFKITLLGLLVPILLTIVLVERTYALHSADKVILTLDNAIAMELRSNYDLQLSDLNLLKSDALVDEAYAGAYPKLNLQGQYVRNLKLPVLFLPPNTPFNPSSQTRTFSIGADNSYLAGVSLSQTLFDARLSTAINIAQKYLQYSKLSDKTTRQDVIAGVKKIFYAVLLSQKLVEVTQQGYDVAKANYENTGVLFKQGVVSEYDYLRAEVLLANVEPALIEAKNNLEMSKNLLKNLLALDLSMSIEVIGNFKVEVISPGLLEKSEELLGERNTLLQILNIQKSILEENVDIEKAAYWPSLSAFGSYNWQTQDNTFNFSAYNWANSITVGFQLSYPLFDGFKREARIEQAAIDLKSIGITRTKTEEGLKIVLLQSKLKMDEAIDRIKAQEKSITQAERALQIAQTRYKNGIGIQLEILDTQKSLTQTRLNYEKAIYDFLIAKIEWERILGISE